MLLPCDVYYFYLRESGTFSFNRDVTVSHGNEAEVNIKADEKASVVADGSNRKDSGGYGFINKAETIIVRIEPESEYKLGKSADYLVWHPLSDLQ